MGEPAELTPRERWSARVLARAVVEAEQCDEKWPKPLNPVRMMLDGGDARNAVYSLARELQLTVDEFDQRLVGVIHRLVKHNNLHAVNLEDTIGVLMRCGAFHACPDGLKVGFIAALSEAIDNYKCEEDL